MSWPTPQDYNEAIQNPRANFGDAALQKMQPALNPLGLPRPITGNFASVYELRSPHDRTAVRCFFREVGDMRLRYAAISTQLRVAALPQMTGFTYLETGIKIRSRMYPVLKMDWIDGQLLDEFVRAHLNDRQSLLRLASTWKDMALDLRVNGIAHGDLQHGNVIVRQGHVKLVDYDGMYVPALSGKASLELGHGNYQHPGRTSTHFDVNMDNFSHWVVYTSLIALAHDPDLWTSLNAGDERLLFGREDFKDPVQSSAFRTLSKHRILDVRRLGATLRAALDLDPSEVPALGSDPVAVGAHYWRLKASPSTAGTGSGHESQSKLPEWLSDHMEPQPVPILDPPGMLPRIWLAGSFATGLAELLPVSVAAPGGLVRFGVAGLLLLSDAAVLSAGFGRNPAVRSRWKKTAEIRTCRRRLHRLDRLIGRLDRGTSDNWKRLDRQAARLQLSIDTAREGFDSRRTDLMTAMQEDLRSLRLVAETWKEEEQRAVDTRLEEQRQAGLRWVLKQHTIRAAEIRGVGPVTKAKLWSAGVRTAADIDASRGRAIAGLGPQRAASLLAWYSSVKRRAARRIPAKLPPEQERKLRRRYEQRRTRIERLQKRILLDASPLLSALESDRRGRVDLLEAELNSLLAVRGGHSRDIELSKQELETKRLALTEHLHEVERDMGNYRMVTFPRYLSLVLLGRSFPPSI